jgi:hypothetical protein
VGPRTGLDAVVKRKFPATARTETQIIQPIAQHYTTELETQKSKELFTTKVKKLES